MKILFSNDDGYDAIGIQTLFNTFKDDHDSHMYAPLVQKTMKYPLGCHFSAQNVVKRPLGHPSCRHNIVKCPMTVCALVPHCKQSVPFVLFSPLPVTHPEPASVWQNA